MEAILDKVEEEFRTRAVDTDEEDLATVAGSPFAKWRDANDSAWERRLLKVLAAYCYEDPGDVESE